MRKLFVASLAFVALSGCAVLKKVEEVAGETPVDVLECFPKLGLWLFGVVKVFALHFLGF